MLEILNEINRGYSVLLSGIHSSYWIRTMVSAFEVNYQRLSIVSLPGVGHIGRNESSCVSNHPRPRHIPDTCLTMVPGSLPFKSNTQSMGLANRHWSGPRI